MMRQNPGSKLKKQDGRKPVKGQSKGGLEKERETNDGGMQSASGLNGTLNNKLFPREIFKMFRGQLGHVMEIYRSIEFACIAVRHGSDWILVSGKAVLSTEPCASVAQIGQVVKLEDIVAFERRIPAEGYKKLEADLRESWVVRDPKEISVRLTPKGAIAYIWQEPKVIESMSRSKLWGRALALKGCYPYLPSRRSDYNLEKINLDLYSSTSPYNGFDGLCDKLGLPARLNNPASLLRFQVSAELPARVTKVGSAKGTFGVDFNCFGTPDLKVKWYPLQPVVERIPATSWDREPSNMACRAPLLTGDGADGAKLILSFGEHIADVASFDFDPRNDLEIVHEVLEDDVDICDLRKMQELSKGEADTASAGPQKLTKARFEHLLWTRRSPERIALLRVLYDECTDSDRGVCVELDRRRVTLPTRWSAKGQYRLIADAYDKDDKLRHNIENEIYKMGEVLSHWRDQARR